MLPETALFRTDPDKQGILAEWYGTNLKAMDWSRLRLDRSWGRQGILGTNGMPYEGIGWYRIATQLTPAQTKGRVKLSFPGLMGQEMWLWVNGRYIGYQTSREDFTFDLSDTLAPGKNLIAVRADGKRSKRDCPFAYSGGIALRPVLYRTLGE